MIKPLGYASVFLFRDLRNEDRRRYVGIFFSLFKISIVNSIIDIQ